MGAVKYGWFILCLVLLINCSSHNQNNQAPTSTTIHPRSGEDTLHIDLDQRRPVKMSELFSSIRYLPLQVNQDNLIGVIWHIIFGGDKIFLYDMSRPAVFIYTQDGQYVNHIPIPEGNGPGELTWLTDVVVDTSNRQISALGLARINTYSFEGDVVHEQRFNATPHNLTLLPTGEFVLHMNNHRFEGGQYRNPGYNLIYMNKNGEIQKQALPIPKSHAMLTFDIPDNFPSYRGRQLFYNSPTDHHIYEITSDTIKVRYYLDFGSYNVPESLYQNRTDFYSGVPFIHKVLEQGYAYLLANFLETDQAVHFYIHIESDTTPALRIYYSKQTGNTLVASTLINDIDQGLAPAFRFRKGNELAAYVQPADLIQKAKEIREQLSPEELQQYREHDQNLIDLTKNMSPMDNPVLMIGKVKDSF